MQDRQKLAQILRSELTFVEQGGYRRRPRYPWRPSFVFEDSPTCINFYHGYAERRPCGECPLIEFVPQNRRNTRFPCRHIDLTGGGEPVNSFYEWTALSNWLKQTIRELDAQDNARIQAA